MKYIGTIILFAVFFYMISGYSMGSEQKPSIKIVYEISPEVESRANFIEDNIQPQRDIKKNAGYLELKYDKSFENSRTKSSLLIKDDSNCLSESTKSSKVQEALDIIKITRGLYKALANSFAKKGFLINNRQGDYVVSFMINEVGYDDFVGECYIRSASYKLIKGSDIIYRGSFAVSRKKHWFGGYYTELLKTDKVANRIIDDLKVNGASGK